MIENLRKLEILNNDKSACISNIAEARSSGKSGSLATLISRLRLLSNQYDNLYAVVERQKSIKSLWSLPTPAYKRKVSEVKDLEGKLLVAITMME